MIEACNARNIQKDSRVLKTHTIKRILQDFSFECLLL